MTVNQCFCQSFEFGTFEVDSDTDYTTGCTESTARVFSQGHDAKLAGYLVRAELGGEEIRRNNGGVTESFQNAVHAASVVSPAFAAKVQAMMDAAKRRMAKKALSAAIKAAKASNKAAKAAEVELAPIEAMIKVGRWEYPAQIDRTTREATYTSKKGATKTIPQGEYTIVE